MARKIDTDAVINSIRLAEQAGDVVAVAAGYWQTYAKEGGLYLEDDNEVVGGPLGTAFEPGGRLTLTTATPVTTADVTGAATLYYTPYKHNMISVYDGARWIPKTFAELSLSLVGYTASKPYDIFAYLNSGAVALESLVWTDGTTRATALAYQDGRLVKSGAATRIYLGTIYINASGAQTDDSVTKRFVWNYYNRIPRLIAKTDATGHNYTTGAWRAWNNDANQKIEFMNGVVELPHQLSLNAQIETTLCGVHIDATNDVLGEQAYINLQSMSTIQRWGISFHYLPAVGYHYYAVTEYGYSGATQTMFYLTGTVRA